MYQLHQDIHRHIRGQIERAIDNLRQNTMKYRCIKYQLCDGCFRRKPPETKRCGSCGSREFSEEHCQQPLRLTWFMDWLETCCLWPSSSRDGRSCQSLIQSVNACVMPSLLHTSWAHACEAENQCPYEVAKHTVMEAIRRAPQNVHGLQLRDYPRLSN